MQKKLSFLLAIFTLLNIANMQANDVCPLCDITCKNGITHLNTACPIMEEQNRSNYIVSAYDRLANIVNYLKSPGRKHARDVTAVNNLCEIVRNQYATEQLKDAAHLTYLVNFELKNESIER